jgi:hypothetical protein
MYIRTMCLGLSGAEVEVLRWKAYPFYARQRARNAPEKVS